MKELLVNIRTGKLIESGTVLSERNSSRTLAQAFSYIGEALSNPGKVIELVDHAVRDGQVGYRLGAAKAVNSGLADLIIGLATKTEVVGLKLIRQGDKLSLSYQPYVPLEEVIDEWRKGK